MDTNRIVLRVTDPLGREAVFYSKTVEAKKFSHMDVSGKISLEEVSQCVSDPDLIVVTAQIEEYPERRVYYRRGDLSYGAPPYRRVVVDYIDTPGPIVSWHRTSTVGAYTQIEFGPRMGRP